jgi:hypothetical protein
MRRYGSWRATGVAQLRELRRTREVGARTLREIFRLGRVTRRSDCRAIEREVHRLQKSSLQLPRAPAPGDRS